MKKYRIKQIGNKFYPRYKKFFGWGYYKGKPYLAYGASSLLTTEKCVFYENLYFESFEKANDFLIEEKKSDIIAYHEINDKS